MSNNLAQLTESITALRNENQKNSVSPENVGYIFQQIVDYVVNLNVSGIEGEITDISSWQTTISNSVNSNTHNISALSGRIDGLQSTQTTFSGRLDAISDEIEQLTTDLGSVETAAGNAQVTATQALTKANEALESPMLMRFSGFNLDDSGYSGNGVSTQPALSVRFHTLYGHFEATVQEGSTQKAVRRWEGSEKYNSYDADGTPHPLPDRLFIYNNSLYVSGTDALQEL